MSTISTNARHIVHCTYRLPTLHLVNLLEVAAMYTSTSKDSNRKDSIVSGDTFKDASFANLTVLIEEITSEILHVLRFYKINW